MADVSIRPAPRISTSAAPPVGSTGNYRQHDAGAAKDRQAWPSEAALFGVQDNGDGSGSGCDGAMAEQTVLG